MLSAISGATGNEVACNDDGVGFACGPVGGGSSFGSQILNFVADRGIHDVVIYSRGTSGTGLRYQLTYDIPYLEI